MKKIFSKKSVIGVMIFLSLLLGSVTVLASTKFSSEILSIMRSSFSVSIGKQYDTIHSEKQKKVAEYKETLEEYIDRSSDQVLGDIENYAQQETTRIDTELADYGEELIEQLEIELDQEEERLRILIDEYIDTKIREAKKDLDNEIYQQYVNRLREQLGQ